MEQPPLDTRPDPLGALHRSCSPVPSREEARETQKLQTLTPRVPSPPLLQRERLQGIREEDKEGGQIKMEVSSYSCQATYGLPPESEPKPDVMKDPEHYPSCVAADSDNEELQHITSAVCEQEQPHTPINSHTPSQKESVTETPVYHLSASNSPLPLIVGPEDPMAGMFALLAASEIVQARPTTPPAPTLLPQIEIHSLGVDCSGAGALEMVALEGMALLSQMAQREMEHISMEQGEEI